jgi:MYXO-CTERM domain-containing protein
MRGRTLASVVILSGVLAQPAYVAAQVDSPTTNDTNVDRRDENDNWGWLGLLGLIGLAGLRRRERGNDRVDVRTSSRTT